MEICTFKAFQLKSNGIPGIVAAVDGCHIQCRQPPGNANDFYNRKGNHSIILQGTYESLNLFPGGDCNHHLKNEKNLTNT